MVFPNNYCTVREIDVHPDYRSKRAGSTLLRRVPEANHEAGVRSGEIAALGLQSNEDSIQLLERAGYERGEPVLAETVAMLKRIGSGPES